jgi:hypothetical protein
MLTTTVGVLLCCTTTVNSQIAATADLRPPLSNVEWFELAESRTKIDVLYFDLL